MREWKPIEGAPLLAFVRGKTIATMQHDGFDSTVIFTDGTAVRCTPIDGEVYSEYSADHATVEWEASDEEQPEFPEKSPDEQGGPT